MCVFIHLFSTTEQRLYARHGARCWGFNIEQDRPGLCPGALSAERRDDIKSVHDKVIPNSGSEGHEGRTHGAPRMQSRRPGLV